MTVGSTAGAFVLVGVVVADPLVPTRTAPLLLLFVHSEKHRRRFARFRPPRNHVHLRLHGPGENRVPAIQAVWVPEER